jgi:hypothetical protein
MKREYKGKYNRRHKGIKANIRQANSYKRQGACEEKKKKHVIRAILCM